MLADPQLVTIATVEKTLPAVERGNLASKYREDTGEHELVVSTSFGKRSRSLARLNHTKTAADPLTAETKQVAASVYVVMDISPFGYTATEVDNLAQGLFAHLDSATLKAILGGQS